MINIFVFQLLLKDSRLAYPLFLNDLYKTFFYSYTLISIATCAIINSINLKAKSPKSQYLCTHLERTESTAIQSCRTSNNQGISTRSLRKEYWAPPG